MVYVYNTTHSVYWKIGGGVNVRIFGCIWGFSSWSRFTITDKVTAGFAVFACYEKCMFIIIILLTNMFLVFFRKRTTYLGIFKSAYMGVQIILRCAVVFCHTWCFLRF